MTLWPFLHWLAVHTGTLIETGPYYGFFSGFGSDIGEVAIIGGMITFARHHNCHQPRCWRIGRHRIEGTDYVVCRKHHPEDAKTYRRRMRLDLAKLRGEL